MHISRILRRRPSPALVVACIALAVALGGTGYAAVRLAPESVGTAQLKDNAVVSSKVRNYTLVRADFRPGQVPRGLRGLRGLRGFTGHVGPVGPAGPTGPAGPAGAPATASTITVRASSVTVPGNTAGNGAYATRAVQVDCAADERGIGGGSTWDNDGNDLELATVYSRPILTGTKITGWRARGGSDIATNAQFSVFALCEK
jgi:hypothetical protein